MKLKTAIFYQSVKNWDNNESNTFKEDPTQIIELEDHLVKVSKEGKKEVIIVPTANLRYAIADYYAEAYKVSEPQPLNLLEIPDSSIADQADEICKEESNTSEKPTSSKKKANAK